MPSWPSRSAVRFRSTGHEVPAIAAPAEAGQVDPWPGIPQAFEIAVERGGVAHHVVSEGRRLCVLQMGIAGHQGLGVDLGLGEHTTLQVNRLRRDLQQQVSHVETFRGGALVVAAAPGLQTAGDVLPHPPGEVVLGLHQERAGFRQIREARAVAVVHVQQAFEQPCPAFGREDAGLGQHHRMGQIRQHIFAETPPETRKVGNFLALDQHPGARAEAGFFQEHVVLAAHRRSSSCRLDCARPGPDRSSGISQK